MSIAQESTLIKFWARSTVLTLKHRVTPKVSYPVLLEMPNSCCSADFQPCNSYSLATLKVVVDSFRDIYPINNGISLGQPLAVGRYPEDTYFGGNPWYLTTLAVAEFLYDAVAQFEMAESLTIDDINLAFFKDIYPNATTGIYRGNNLNDVLASMTNYADGFVSVVQVISVLTFEHVPPANQAPSNTPLPMDLSLNRSAKPLESLSPPMT